MSTLRRRGPRRGDAGDATLDYVGVIVVVALVCGLVAVGVRPVEVASAFRDAVCTILQLGGGCESGPGAAGPTDEDLQPGQCKIRENTEKGGVQVKLGWFTIGEEYGFVRQEFSDGTVRLTLVDSASVGAVASGQEKLFDIGKLGDDAKAGASVEVAAGLKFGYGSTWQFDDADQAEEFRGEIEKYAMQQQQMKGRGAAGTAIWLSLTDGWADPPDPAITFARTSLELSAKGALGVKLPTGPADAAGQVPTADPALGVSFTVKGEYEVLMERNARTGTTSWVYQLSPQVEGSASAIVVGAEGFRRNSGAFRVTRDEKGELVSLSFISTEEQGGQINLGVRSPVAVGGTKGTVNAGDGASGATVTVTTLPVTTPQDRRIAQAWLAGTDEQFGSPFRLTVDALVPDEPPAAGDDFGRLLYEKATVAQTGYRNVTDVQEFGAEVNLGWKVGFSFSLENSSSTASDAAYLGAPGADGARPLLDFAECY